VAWEDSDQRERIESMMKAAVKWMGINPWCGLCGSTKLHFEDAVTPFATLAEANESLKVCEAAQAVTREVFSQLPKTN